MEVRYHPLFEKWLAELAEADEEIFGEVMALLNALEKHGRELDDESREESHPVVTSRFDMHALRRTPPSEAAPYADPPVLRILYAMCTTNTGSEAAVVLLGGDKTTLGTNWVPGEPRRGRDTLGSVLPTTTRRHRDHQARQPMSPRTIPTDTATATDATITDAEWEQADNAHERFKALLETKPRAKARHDAVLAEINSRQATLRRLREARALTQSTVAELLDMDQSEVSRLERRSDMLLSTLKRFVQATGGEMHIVVSYPDGGPVELLVSED